MKILDTYPNLSKLNCKARKNSSIIYLGRIELLYIYCRHPFNTSARGVRVTNPCKPGHEGAKDLNFPGMPYGTPVFAMESGVVVEARRDRIPCQGSPPDCLPNNVVVQGSDGFYTEYAHVKPFRNPYLSPRPSIGIGRQIRAGQLLGYVDNSGPTQGDPVVHIARYTPGSSETWYSRPSPCDWYIHRVDAPYTDPYCFYALGHGRRPFF